MLYCEKHGELDSESIFTQWRILDDEVILSKACRKCERPVRQNMAYLIDDGKPKELIEAWIIAQKVLENIYNNCCLGYDNRTDEQKQKVDRLRTVINRLDEHFNPDYPESHE